MSGGSFNYAYSAMDLDDFARHRHDWIELRDAFEVIGADDVAAEIDATLAYLRIAERRIVARLDRLRDVAKAMEWLHSCDWTREQLDEAVAKYRREAKS